MLSRLVGGFRCSTDSIWVVEQYPRCRSPRITLRESNRFRTGRIGGLSRLTSRTQARTDIHQPFGSGNSAKSWCMANRAAERCTQVFNSVCRIVIAALPRLARGYCSGRHFRYELAISIIRQQNRRRLRAPADLSGRD